MLQEDTITGNGAYQVGSVTIQRRPPRQSIMDNLVTLSVKLRALSTKRKINSTHVEIDADKSMIHVSKDIFESAEYAAITKLDSQIRRYVESKCASFDDFRSGLHLLKLKLVAEVDAELANFAVRRKALVLALKDRLPDIIADAKARLRSEFKPTDYPSAEALEGRFSMTWAFCEFSTPGSLPPEMRMRETEKLKATFSNAFEKSTKALTAGVAEVVEFAIAKLSPKPDGTRNMLTEKGSENMLTKIREFIDSIDALNIADAAELAKLGEQAESILNGVSPEGLRNSEIISDRVREGFQTLKANLDAMIVEKGREISFDEE